MADVIDLSTFVSTCVAASLATNDDAAATYFAAAARVALNKLAGELRELELLVAAREQELVRRGAPKQQLTIVKDSGQAPR
jgi:hypothetical protein